MPSWRPPLWQRQSRQRLCKYYSAAVDLYSSRFFPPFERQQAAFAAGGTREASTCTWYFPPKYVSLTRSGKMTAKFEKKQNWIVVFSGKYGLVLAGNNLYELNFFDMLELCGIRRTCEFQIRFLNQISENVSIPQRHGEAKWKEKKKQSHPTF